MVSAVGQNSAIANSENPHVTRNAKKPKESGFNAFCV